MGAFADGEPIAVSVVSSLADAQLSYSSLSRVGAARRRLCSALSTSARSAGAPAPSATSGRTSSWPRGPVDIGLDPEVSLWDLAALQVIVEEAGGRFTDLGGEARADGGSAVSTNGLLHADVLGVLRP